MIGKGDVIKGVEDAVKNMNVGEEKKVEIEPKDAFGERDPSLVKVIALSEFTRRGIDPYPGMEIDINGAKAVVKSVNSGRVVVDENHELAGEKLVYQIKIVDKIENDDEKIKAISRKLGLDPSKVAVEGSKANIEFGDSTEKTAEYEGRKSTLPNYIFRYMPNIDTVEIKDTYKKPKEQKESENVTNK